MSGPILGLNRFKKKEEKSKTVQDTLKAPEVKVPEYIAPVIPGQEEVKSRSEERNKIEQLAAAPTFTKPEDFNSTLKQISNIASGLSPDQSKLFEDRKNKIEAAKEQALSQYEKDKDTNKWLQVAESLGQALVQLGAGAYGLKHNTDLSGLKFNQTDWSKNIDQASRDLDRKLGMISADERGLEKEESQLTKKLADDSEFRKKSILQDYMAQQQAYKQQVLQAQRLAEQASNAEAKSLSTAEKQQKKEAGKQLSLMQKKQEARVKLLDKALAEANAVKEGAKGASLDKVAKILGGVEGEQFRKDITSPVSIFGFELWESADEDEAAKVLKGYLNQAKAALTAMNNDTAPQQEQIKQTGPQPGDVQGGYEFIGGNPADQANWKKVK